MLAAILLPIGAASGNTPLRSPAPLSNMAQLGARLFHDMRLSASERMSCASCHSPSHAYGPAGSASVMLGGPELKTPGFRAVPSLEYLYLQPAFGIGADSDQPIALAHQAQLASGHARALKTAQAPQAAAANLVPQGGLFWDGRADRLDEQIDGPLYNPAEMDAGPPARVLRKLATAPNAGYFVRIFGPAIFREPQLALDDAALAIARYELENPAFHPFTSKFDAWLAGKARLTATELRGYRLFNDPAKGNCAACHLDKPTQAEPSRISSTRRWACRATPPSRPTASPIITTWDSAAPSALTCARRLSTAACS